MKKLPLKKTVSLIIAFIVIGFACGGLILANRHKDELEYSKEFVDEFLISYDEMMTKGDEENVLIVMSSEYPKTYGAIDIAEAPNQTYFLMYDSGEARDEAYTRFKEDNTISVDKNISMHLLEHNSWGVERMGLDNGISAVSEGGEPVEVAILDTGLDVDLFRTYYPNKTLITHNLEAGSYNPEDMVDYHGHGSHVAGIVADGTPDNVSLYIIRVARGSSADVYSADVVTAIYEAVNNDVEVMNISLGAYAWIDAQKVALDYAVENNVVTVVSAGNDGKTDVMYPAGYDNTLSISAIDPDDSLANYSNYGETIDFAAPGSSIRSINGVMSGTSMAAPHVAAAVAILKSFNSELTFDATKNLLIQYVRDLGTDGWDHQFGYGLIDFGGAVFCGDRYCDEYGVFAVDITVNVKSDEIEATVLKDGIVVTAEDACAVITSDDGGDTYEVVQANAVDGEDNSYKFSFNVPDGTEVTVVFRGDGNMDGMVTSADSNLINRSLISSGLEVHKSLTALQRVIFDLNKDGEITSADSNLINRSLISHSLGPYRRISW